MYAQAANSSVAGLSLREPPACFSDMRYVSGRADAEFREALGPGFGTAADSPLAGRAAAPTAAPAPAAAAAPGGGRGVVAPPPAAGALTIEGLPLMKPPYGVLSAIDLDKGELKWQVAHGDTPDAFRATFERLGLKVPKTGQNGSIGLMVTKTLVILGDLQVTTTPDHPRGAMLRGYDKQTGKEMGTVFMPAPQSGSPMTYAVDGKQYIVVAVSGGNYSGEYIAFTLPSNTAH
jgi:quinoprotein glucose dehydrogenase